MAVIDYGAVAFKDDKLISTGLFTPMKTTCGFSDADEPRPGSTRQFDKNDFVVIGNKDLLIGFYKTTMYWWVNDPEDPFQNGAENFGWSHYRGWKHWTQWFADEGDSWAEILVKPKNGYYVADIKMRYDTYKVYFGYGVDYNFYKKTHRFNYYRSPEYFLRELWWKVKHRTNF